MDTFTFSIFLYMYDEYQWPTVVTGTLGSAAHASKDKFLPYFQPTMNKLQHFLILTGEGEETELRGIAMDAVGTFAEAFGVDVFRPYLADMMKQAFQGVEMGSARLRDCNFLFFGVIARSCKQAEHGEDNVSTFSNTEAAAAFESGSSTTNTISVTDDVGVNGNLELEIGDIDLDKMLEVNSMIAVEKEIAADTIGTLFAATHKYLFPFVEPCALELVNLLTHYYEDIRKSATDSWLEIVRTFYELRWCARLDQGLGRQW
ncbi:hypothetical protein DEU56DRAFT_984393 [Suillus clintonianus]|uniref:uncharacterized protein n=1 Tax=Suillus clintonianus TaxID=1904413 RepID=UPI001B877B1B|nr:uncharacterized protein DEU56DRAFT_984393 [Suillus clintonianus]KAG2121239.1 hypothetical protein DEU56DRAFT_984393 [Suillus clintonianus]